MNQIIELTTKVERVDQKLLNIRLSHNERNGNFYIDFWEVDKKNNPVKYIISQKITEAHALKISVETGIRIFY